MTEDIIRKDISEVSRPGDRCKTLDAIANEKKRQNLNVSAKVNLGEGSTNVAQQSDGGTGSTSSQDLEWKRQWLSYITNPIGLRAIYYMKTMPTFYEQVRPYIITDEQFKLEFCDERACQYEMLTSLEKLEKKMESTCFNSKSLLFHGRYLNVQYEVKVTDLNSLSAVSIPEVKSLIKHARALKRKLNKHDKSLFSANGLHLKSPRLPIHHEFNKETMEKVEKKKEKLVNLLQSLVQKLSEIKQLFNFSKFKRVSYKETHLPLFYLS